MDMEYFKNKVKNFRKEEWILGKEAFTLKEDKNIVLKLTDKKIRIEDDMLSDSVWDDFFDKYNIEYIISAKIYYKEMEFEVPLTLFETKGVIIPFAEGAKLINEFSEHEYEIAKAFSVENNKLNEFNKIMEGYKIYSEEKSHH